MPTLAQNRTAKALKLADVLAAQGASSAQLEDLPEEGWSMAAQVAGVGAPSQETKEIVVALLRHQEEHPDPFEGLV